MSVLKIEGLSHRYSSSWAVRDINLEINQHGIVGLLGSNGAGKSTMMNIVCGVLNQTEGSVTINGVDTRKQAELAKQQIGFLPQQLPLYTDLTVDEYLQYTAELRAIPKDHIKKAITEVKEKVGIAHFSSRLIRNLSGGYKQRVGIAQAIIHKPKLVVMDEPTTGLDPNQLIEARKLLQEIGKEHTVLLSSHILPEIQLMCREIIMIEGGRIIFSDSMDAFNNYIQPGSVLISMENPPAEADLLQIHGATKVEYLTKKQIRLYFEGDADITERLVHASVQHNWQLRELSLERSLLDDIFKQLSTKTN